MTRPCTCGRVPTPPTASSCGGALRQLHPLGAGTPRAPARYPGHEGDQAGVDPGSRLPAPWRADRRGRGLPVVPRADPDGDVPVCPPRANRARRPGAGQRHGQGVPVVPGPACSDSGRWLTVTEPPPVGARRLGPGNHVVRIAMAGRSGAGRPTMGSPLRSRRGNRECAVVDTDDTDGYRCTISSGDRQWLMSARAVGQSPLWWPVAQRTQPDADLANDLWSPTPLYAHLDGQFAEGLNCCTGPAGDMTIHITE